MFDEMLHGISRGDYSTVFICFWVLRLNPEEGKRVNFRYDLIIIQTRIISKIILILQFVHCQISEENYSVPNMGLDKVCLHGESRKLPKRHICVMHLEKYCS
jgi:hypothetical protein